MGSARRYPVPYRNDQGRTQSCPADRGAIFYQWGQDAISRIDVEVGLTRGNELGSHRRGLSTYRDILLRERAHVIESILFTHDLQDPGKPLFPGAKQHSPLPGDV